MRNGAALVLNHGVVTARSMALVATVALCVVPIET